MKRIFAFTWLVFVLSIPTLPAAQEGGRVRTESALGVSERGAHQKVWSKVITTTLPNGRVRYETNVAYIEMAAGLHYQNPNQPGQWLESRDEIELFQDGAIARQGPFQVIWAPNLATPGAIDLMTPDQKRFRTHVLGLALHDSATGHSELIAEVQDCLGELEGANQIIYADAFDGVSGSVRYTLTRDRFEQDIILYERIALPVGFNPATTRLEIWSEMVDPVEPVITTRPIGGMDDSTLDFGATRIGPGRAFSLEDPQGRTWSAPMMKSWVKPEPGRTFLIEAIGFETVQPQLDLLPARPQGAALGAPPAAGGARRQMALNAEGQRVFPARAQAAKVRGKIQHARLESPSPLGGERAGVRGEEAMPNIQLPTSNAQLSAASRGGGASTPDGAERVEQRARLAPPSLLGGERAGVRGEEAMPNIQLPTSNAQLPTSSRGGDAPSPDGAERVEQRARLAPPSPLRGERAGVRGDKALNSQRPTSNVQLSSAKRGLVLDYSLVTTTSNVVFKGDTTWFISGNLTLTGTNTLEGGTVIKATNGSTLTLAGSLDCRTDAYLPATFTSWCDDSIGGSITGSTGNPSTNRAAFALYMDAFTAGVTSRLSHLHIAYADVAASFYTGHGHEVLDVQVVHCPVAFKPYYGTVLLRNVLAYDSTTFVAGSITSTCRVENATVAIANALRDNTILFFTNSLLSSVTNVGIGDFTGANNSSSAAFQTVGASSAYLLDNTYRNAGTTNIDATLLAELRQRTTYPPVVLSNTTISLDTTLYPQAQRDTDTPDLGYHPPALDYVVGGVVLTNATLTLAAGTALGVFTPPTRYGLMLQGAQLLCEGTPARPNHITRYHLVQEQANTNWIGNEPMLYTTFFGSAAASTARFRFTSLDAPAGGKLLKDTTLQDSTFTFTDSTLANGSLEAYRAVLRLTNSLLDRVITYLDDLDAEHAITARNTLFREGSLSLTHYGSATWEFKDNLFDNTTLSQDGDVSNGYNAYTTNLVRTNLTARLLPQGANDVKLAVTNFAHQTGPLGRYYQPSGSLLINAGSISDAATGGFYHYSTITNGTKEANTVLDISFHYLSGSGWGTTFASADGDGDGWADYLEDTNGSGAVNSGETDWSNASDRGLKVQITNPKGSTQLP